MIMAIVPPLIMKLAMTISPTPALPPEGEGGKVSLREFYDKLSHAPQPCPRCHSPRSLGLGDV